MEDRILDNSLTTGVLKITPEIKKYLMTTAKWSKFISIVSFIFIGLFLLIMVGMLVFGISSFPADMTGGLAMTPILITYIIITLLYLMPTLYLYRFSSNMKRALLHDNDENLRISFMNLKSCFSFMGIFMAIVLGIYVLLFVFGLLFGGAAFLGGF